MSTLIARLAGTGARWAVFVLVPLLASCGGGGDGAQAPVAQRLEAGPQSVLLVGVGATRTLSARLIDAAGAPVSGTVTWSSSNPAAVSVDSAGTVSALVGAGSAQVTASSGALSAAVLVTVAQPVAGAQLIADDQIVSGPTAVDPAAVPAAGNPYEVVLRGAPALSVGSILIASEAANVAGRVVSVQPEGANLRVRLVVVPPTQLFSAFDFQDTVDLTQGSIETPPELAAAYDVAQSGNTFVFTPRPGALSDASTRERASAATGTRALPPFNGCEVSPDGLPLPLALSAAPAFELTVDGTVERRATAQGVQFIATAKPKFKLNSVLTVAAVFEAKVTCKVTLKVVKFRAPGWAGLFFGGDVEFGVGFEAGGKFTLANAKVGGAATLDTDLQATLDCPTGADCSLGGSSSAVTELTPVLQAPALEQAQFEPSVSLFGFVSLEAGNADIEQLQFSAIELKAGVELAGSVAPEALQITNLDADSGRSKYALAFKGDVGPGIKLGEFLAFVGLSEVVPLKLGFAVDLGASPSAVSVVADKASYLPGERASVTVKLTPASTLFPSGLFYNVHRVVLLRKTGVFSTEVLASQLAADAQTDFTLGFDATSLINAGEIFAFVETKLLPTEVPTFELAAAQAAPIVDFVDRFSLIRVQATNRLLLDQRISREFGTFDPGPLSFDLGRARARADQVSSMVTGADGSVIFQMRGSAQFQVEPGEPAGGTDAETVFNVRFEISKPMSYALIGTMNLQANGPKTTGFVRVSLSPGNDSTFEHQCAADNTLLSPCAGVDVTIPMAASGVLSPGIHTLSARVLTGANQISAEQGNASVDFTLTLTP